MQKIIEEQFFHAIDRRATRYCTVTGIRLERNERKMMRKMEYSVDKLRVKKQIPNIKKSKQKNQKEEIRQRLKIGENKKILITIYITFFIIFIRNIIKIKFI